MKKRVLALILTLVLTLSVFPVAQAVVIEPNVGWGDEIVITLGEDITGTTPEKSTNKQLFKLKVPQTAHIPFALTIDGKVIRWNHDSPFIMDIYNSSYKCIYTTGDNAWRDAQSTMSFGEGVTLEAGVYHIKITKDPNEFSTEKLGKRYQLSTCSHALGEETVAKEPTCSEYGEKQSICTICGNVALTQQIERLPHTPGEWEVTKEPDGCKKDGERVRYCEVCHAIVEKETIKAADHTPGEWVVLREPEGCGTSGERVKYCQVCDGVVEREVLKAAEHSYGAWVVTKQGNCKTPTQMERKCAVCDHVEQETKFEDHDWSDEGVVRQESTCAKQGVRVHTCPGCKQEKGELLPLAEHQYGEWVRQTEPTCSYNGFMYRNCKVCKTAVEEKTLEKLPHTLSVLNEGMVGGRNAYRDRCSVCTYRSKPYYEKGRPVTVTRANTDEPSQLPWVVPAFSDVSSSSWYQSVVTYAYNLDLMVGNSDTTFNPMGNVTVAEAVTMAARARNSYEGSTNDDFKASGVWYQTYVDYAIKKNIIKAGDFDRYDRVATRAEMAYIFAHALPDSGMKAINKVTKLPDVDANAKYSKEIFTLYNAGILTGSDASGTFSPNNPITRSEAAAIITRVTLSSERKTLDLK